MKVAAVGAIPGSDDNVQVLVLMVNISYGEWEDSLQCVLRCCIYHATPSLVMLLLPHHLRATEVKQIRPIWTISELFRTLSLYSDYLSEEQ